MSHLRLLSLSALLLLQACVGHLASSSPPGSLIGPPAGDRSVIERGSITAFADEVPWQPDGDELVVEERQRDGSLACYRRFELAAEAVDVEAACAGCGPVWRVSFRRVDDPGEVGLCTDPKTPRDGEVRLLAWSPKEASVYRGWSEASPWVWWYSGVKHGGLVSFHWSAAPDRSPGWGHATARR